MSNKTIRMDWIAQKFVQYPALRTDVGHDFIIKLAEDELTDNTMNTLQKSKIIAQAVRDRNSYIQANWQTLDERVKFPSNQKKAYLSTVA